MEDIDYNFYETDNQSKEEITLDMFNQENIGETLKKYNYDYKTLLRELTTFIDFSELMEIVKTNGIKKEEYSNPTYEIFDKIRDGIINNRNINN